MVAPRYLLALAVASLGFSGCAANMQDLHYSVVNKTRAEYSWYSSTSFSDRWNCGSDYAYGYKSGYYDAATGRGCVLPAVPPPCYWSTKYQCCEGQQHIQDWYRGYQCGVAAAQGTGYPSFHHVPKGPQAPVLNKEGCGACYGPTGCLCENETPGAPAIAHLSSAEAPAPAATGSAATMPIYPVSATAGEQIDIGLIGPAGVANPVPKTPATPSVRTAGAMSVSAVPAMQPVNR